jgi:two-component system chemotaxis response regulator CheY
MRSISEPVKPDKCKPNILIVDDSEGIRLCVRTILEVLDVDLSEASDGAQALARLVADDYDIVVTDLEMAPLSGFDLIAGLEHLPARRRRPKVIVCSALVGTHILADRKELMGANALLQKPVRAAELLGEVIKALEEA